MSKMKNLLLKVALLSCVLVMASLGAINGIIPEIAKAFPNVPLSTIELISTMPSLFLMGSVLTSRFIAKKIGYKLTMQIGIGLTIVSGIVPMMFGNIYLILISRAILGFGVGMFASLLIALICYFYEGSQRSFLIGLQGTVLGLGGLIITFFAGQMIKINWQAPFAAYLIAVPVLVMVSLFVPKVSTEEILAQNVTLKKKREALQSATGHLHESYLPVIGLMVLIFLSYLLYMTMGIKESSLMSQMGYGNSTDGSTVIMMICIGAMASGLLYSKYSKVTKKFTMPIGFAIMGIAILLMGYSNTVFLTAFGGFMAGAANQFLLPYMTEIVNKGSARLGGIATSLLIVGQNLGSFLSPYGSMLLENISPMKNLRGLFYVDGLIFLILALGGVVMVLFSSAKTKESVLVKM